MSVLENAIYQRWSDNVARTATLSIEIGTAPSDSVYGPSALVDDNPALVAKIESDTGAWLIDSGAATDVQIVGLIHHTFDAGADVRLQATNDLTDFGGSPTGPIPFDAPITIPPWLGVGTRLWPVNPWLDLTQVAGYNPTGWRYRRLIGTGNSQPLQLGQLWLGSTIRRFNPDVQWGVTRGHRKPLVENITPAAVSWMVSRLTTLWRQEGVLLDVDDLMVADLLAHWYDVDGRSLPWLLVPDGTVNACYLVRWMLTDHAFQWQFPSIRNFVIRVEEASRGLRPGV